jgi:hypothetical protein
MLRDLYVSDGLVLVVGACWCVALLAALVMSIIKDADR